MKKECMFLAKSGNNQSNVMKKKCRSMPKREEQKSFVEDLRDQYPELRKDKTLLVTTLAVIMENVKPTPPPDNYCVKVDDVYK